uniref:Uncharacterized protein n=1 Tax=Anguilla anguilla TaxID=7936 RepID=A0A0E9PRU5_ANGAN
MYARSVFVTLRRIVC